MLYAELAKKLFKDVIPPKYTGIKTRVMDAVNQLIAEIVKAERKPFQALAQSVMIKAFPDMEVIPEHPSGPDLKNAFHRLEHAIEYIRRIEEEPVKNEQPPTRKEIVERICELINFVPSSGLSGVMDEVRVFTMERLKGELEAAAKEQEIRSQNIQSVYKIFTSNGESKL